MYFDGLEVIMEERYWILKSRYFILNTSKWHCDECMKSWCSVHTYINKITPETLMGSLAVLAVYIDVVLAVYP